MGAQWFPGDHFCWNSRVVRHQEVSGRALEALKRVQGRAFHEKGAIFHERGVHLEVKTEEKGAKTTSRQGHGRWFSKSWEKCRKHDGLGPCKLSWRCSGSTVYTFGKVLEKVTKNIEKGLPNGVPGTPLCLWRAHFGSLEFSCDFG